MIKHFDTPGKFFEHNKSIFNSRLEYFHLIKIYESFNPDFQVSFAFNVYENENEILGFSYGDHFLIYSKFWTEKMLVELSGVIQLKRFKNFHFTGTRQLLMELLKLNPEVKYKVYKDRIVYNLTTPPTRSVGTPGQAVISRLNHLKILGKINYDYSLEEWGERENRDLGYSIKQASSAIQQNCMFHWENENTICSMLQVLDLDDEYQ